MRIGQLCPMEIPRGWMGSIGTTSKTLRMKVQHSVGRPGNAQVFGTVTTPGGISGGGHVVTLSGPAHDFRQSMRWGQAGMRLTGET